MSRQMINQFITKANAYRDALSTFASGDPARASQALASLVQKFEHYPEITDTDVIMWLPQLMNHLNKPQFYADAGRGIMRFGVPVDPPGMDIATIAQRTGDLSFPME